MANVVRKSLKKSDVTMARCSQDPVRPRLLSLQDSAVYMGTTTWFMRTLVWNGRIPCVRFAEKGKVFIDLEDLNEFIDKHKRGIG